MHLTVDQVYKIAERLLDDEYILLLKKSSVFSDWPLTKIAVIAFNHTGDMPVSGVSGLLFKSNDLGDELRLIENNGRIYYFIYNNKRFKRRGKTLPITDQVLKDFELTIAGEEFVKKYLEER